MSKQDKQEPNNQQPVIEDLTVNEAESAEVKGGSGGRYLLELRDVKGDVSS